MKARTFSVLAGAAGSLTAVAAAPAEFVDVDVEVQVVNVVDDPVVGAIDLSVFTLIANFDAPGDQLIAVAGLPSNLMNITITSGSFWNHPLNGATAPPPELVASSPAALHDSFVDIGQEVNTGGEPSAFAPGLGGSDPLFSTLGGMQDVNMNGVPDGGEIAWARIPDDPLTDPFDSDTLPGSGQVLIGRFSVLLEGAGELPDISGVLTIQTLGAAGAELHPVSFTTVPAPATLGLLATAGLLGCGRRRRRS